MNFNSSICYHYAQKFKRREPYHPASAPHEACSQYPSRWLSNCNILFEQFVMNYGTTDDVKSIKNRTFDISEILSKYSMPFFTRILSIVHQKHTTWQRMYIRLYLHRSGLNGTGMDFMYLAGLCCSRTTYIDSKAIILEDETKNRLRLINSSHPKIYFMDNYNVAYYLKCQKETGSQVLFQGAGIGLSFNPYSNFVELKRSAEFCSVDMFDIDSCYFSCLEDYYYNLKLNWYFLESESFRNSMFNTPCKPRISGYDLTHMDYYHPIEINQENITSDMGLLKLLHHMDKVVCKDYSGRIYIKFDINIFSRFIKFALLKYPYSGHLRRRFGIYLSPWHSYKHAQLVLFRSNAEFVWLRLWVAAFPSDKTCLLEPSCIQLTQFFNICTIAYSLVVEKLSRLSPSAKSSEAYNRFRNIFEFFLPVVRDYIYNLRLGKTKEFLECRRKLLVLFMSGDKSSLYTNGEILSFLVESYCRKNCADYISLMYDNLMLVNEEIGEVAFSLLARDEYKKGSRFTLSRANTSFKLIRAMRQLNKMYGRGKDKSSKERYRYKSPCPESDQIKRCVSVLKECISDFENNKWYSVQVKKSNHAYQLKGMQLTNSIKVTPFPSTTPTQLLDGKLQKFLNQMSKNMRNAVSVMDEFLRY